MWRLLKIVANRKKHAVVLTTHNMLECEAVCTRIGIMKMGELVCMGNSQHLRSVYGTGFLLEVTVSSVEYREAAKAVKSFPAFNIILANSRIIFVMCPI